ncbi:hypothetical protein BDP81DRAFT_489675 [Colletotrichum phormii]|uniref:BTB domain-containing protein n=1 Tax=Colletotrichum phormii TaxID=359342 RepID=A0AAI9ZR42_9PEZI|nr:uncharacterized protein BDP81DRAFT_489675 [Colletotrichum phormii]KAK1636321.1 hypothetical protein BDP81DRAFT_489675 [Colletotrichum phormii]
MTHESFYRVDPDGDVVLILRNPGASFAEWDSSASAENPAFTIEELRAAADTLKTPEDPYRGLTAAQKKKYRKMLFIRAAELEVAETPVQRTDSPPFDVPPAAGPSDSTGHDSLPIEDTAEPLPAAAPDNEPSQESYEEPVVKYLVSSKHLALASRYFSTKLSGPWIEASFKHADGCFHMDATDWDPEVLLILMQVIHGKMRSVPRQIDLGTLAKMAVLVDYYDCHEVIELYSFIWIEPLRKNLPVDYCRELVLWLFISHVFQQNDTFQQMTQLAVMKTACPIKTMGLPIASIVIDQVEWRRQDAIEIIFGALQKILDALRSGTAGCNFECSSILLGALTKEMDRHRLLDPKPALPYTGYSIENTEKIVRAFRSPQWSTDFLHGKRHSCTLPSMIDCYLNADFDKSKQGFKLSEAVSAQVNGTEKRGKGKNMSAEEDY